MGSGPGRLVRRKNSLKRRPLVARAGDLTASTVQIRELVTQRHRSAILGRHRRAGDGDPDLIGTDVGAESRRTAAAAIRSDTRKAEGEGLHYVQGPDGKMRVFQNRQFLRSDALGTDPTKAFTVDESGKHCRNKQVQDYELSRAKAGRRTSTAVGGDMALEQDCAGGKWTKVCSIPLRR